LASAKTGAAMTMLTFQCADPVDTTEMSDLAMVTIPRNPVAKSLQFQRV
jgi:hypothetical protein